MRSGREDKVRKTESKGVEAFRRGISDRGTDCVER